MFKLCEAMIERIFFDEGGEMNGERSARSARGAPRGTATLHAASRDSSDSGVSGKTRLTITPNQGKTPPNPKSNTPKFMKAASGGSETQEIGPVFLVGRGGVGGGAL